MHCCSKVLLDSLSKRIDAELAVTKGELTILKHGGLVIAVIVGMVAVAAWPQPAAAQTQQGRLEFRAIGQAALPTAHEKKLTDTWGGDVYGSLGGEFLSGIFSGNDGVTTQQGVTGMGTNGTYTYVFGTEGSFEINVAHGDWQFAPGKLQLGDYSGTATIVGGGGTGIFRFAYGTLHISGPFIVWPDQSSKFGIQARFNELITGSICGVQPAS